MQLSNQEKRERLLALIHNAKAQIEERGILKSLPPVLRMAVAPAISLVARQAERITDDEADHIIRGVLTVLYLFTDELESLLTDDELIEVHQKVKNAQLAVHAASVHG